MFALSSGVNHTVGVLLTNAMHYHYHHSQGSTEQAMPCTWSAIGLITEGVPGRDRTAGTDVGPLLSQCVSLSELCRGHPKQTSITGPIDRHALKSDNISSSALKINKYIYINITQ